MRGVPLAGEGVERRGRSTVAYRLTPEYFGVSEDNDPSGRLMAFVNYNTSLWEYCRLAGTGLLPFEAENTGFQIGLNYMMYGLTH